MVASGGFDPPTSSASERRSPTELRAYPEYRTCYTPLSWGVKQAGAATDRKSTRLNSSHSQISYAVFCLKKKKKKKNELRDSKKQLTKTKQQITTERHSN